MSQTSRAHFGIMTAPSQVTYDDVLRVWREADTIKEIEHAWLFDHLMPIFGDPDGPTYEGWTLLSALAAQTNRLRVGLLVTSNRFRPPAMLAKIATTVDIVSGGRLDFGIGAGSRPSHPMARREYEAHGLPYEDFSHSVESLAEALTVIRRLWTETEPFDFTGTHDHYCAEIGRDPASLTRSIHLQVSYDRPDVTREAIGRAIDAGFQHLVLGLPNPYPVGVAQWAVDELITTTG
jgi:alkanesulfonate monooxygenase SsuD/methylene tetrahydromethanopterin reductase-like flavin-dependent oxidoreductase (luciferase family)